ncbi:MAG: DsrE family protein [Paludibacteraceae bacterium]|nr:DsrE family protein [Paludibacteraceae bacterium]
MRKRLLMFIMMSILAFCANAQMIEKEIHYDDPNEPKSIGIVLYSNDVETIYNALRLAIYSQEWDNQVSIFLLGKGVELEGIVLENADIKAQVESFVDLGGVIMGCQTCFQSRKQSESKICKVSCIQDLYDLVKKNQIVLTF